MRSFFLFHPGLQVAGGLTCFMCHFPFAQVFKPSARSAWLFEFWLFFYWTGGSDRVMSALSRGVHCFWLCSTTQNQRLLKESIKIDAKIREIHQHVTWEHRAPRAVPLSEVSVPFRASVQAFSKKCGVFRVLRCFVIELAGLIR